MSTPPPAAAEAPLCGGSPSQPGCRSCDWYLMTFMWDAATGVPPTILLHQYSAAACAAYPRLELLSRIGDYEAARDPVTGVRPPSSTGDRARRWGWQVLHWLGCAVVARALSFGLLLLLLQPALRVANLLGWWACTQPQIVAKYWINMLVLPIALDAAQFAVQNYFLDGRKAKAG